MSHLFHPPFVPILLLSCNCLTDASALSMVGCGLDREGRRDQRRDWDPVPWSLVRSITAVAEQTASRARRQHQKQEW